MASEYAINTGDEYLSPKGEKVVVVGFSGADPKVQSVTLQTERTIAAATLNGWVMTGPDHGLAGVARL
jgi:hypothetical protein